MTLAKVLKRVGCGVALVGWFSFLLLPCALFALARDGEIIIPRSNLPGHVLLHVQLLSDDDYTGLSFRTSVSQRAEPGLQACIRSTVRYIFWRGESVPSVTFCECYSRSDADARWSFTSAAPPATCLTGP